jgi:hypothetical protein
MEGKTPAILLIVVQGTIDPSISENLERVGGRQTRLVEEVIASFNAHASNGHEPTTTYDSPTSAGATFIFNVTA